MQSDNLKLYSAADLRGFVKSGISGGFLFFGPEEYLKEASIALVRESINGGDSENDVFSYTRIEAGDGATSDYTDVLDRLSAASEKISGFCEKSLTELKGLAFGKLSEDELEALCLVSDNFSSSESNILIINSAPDEIDVGILPKRPSALIKSLSEHIKPVYYERQTPAKLAAWTIRHFASAGVTASAGQCHELISRCAGSMRLIASETDKLSGYVRFSGRDRLEDSDISLVSSEYNPESAPFAVSDAILTGNRDALCRAYFDMKLKKVKPELILSQISSVWCDLGNVTALSGSGSDQRAISSVLGMHEFRVGRYLEAGRRFDRARISGAVSMCAEADRMIKSLTTDPYTVIERLIGLM